MGQALIRNIDDALLDNYREAAIRNHRSLEAELREALRRAKPISAQQKREMLALAESVRVMTPADVSQTPSEQLVREQRDGKRE